MTWDQFNEQLAAMDTWAYISLDDAQDDSMIIDGRLTLPQLEQLVSYWKQLREGSVSTGDSNNG
jgi:hypothetical protein